MFEGTLPSMFIASTNLTRSRAFYEGVLGWPVKEETEYACVFDIAGTELRITLVEYFEPQPFTVLGFKVLDLRREVSMLRERGVEFMEYASIEQDQDRIWRTPGGTGVAWMIDPEGNTVSLNGPIQA